jgi:hypothetical protein
LKGANLWLPERSNTAETAYYRVIPQIQHTTVKVSIISALILNLEILKQYQKLRIILARLGTTLSIVLLDGFCALIDGKGRVIAPCDNIGVCLTDNI